MRRWLAILAGIAVLAAAAAAFAQVAEPTRVVNDVYHFAYTVDANSLVTYEEGGNGFSCIHNPAGGGKGTTPDYGMQVFAGPVMKLTAEEAKLAKLEPPVATVLAGADVGDNTRMGEIMKGAMAAHERQPAGEATVKVEGGSGVKAPYFTWSKTAAGKTHYALMYVVVHGDYFINVQVEASRPLTKAQEQWFTTKLELLKLPPPLSAAK